MSQPRTIRLYVEDALDPVTGMFRTHPARDPRTLSSYRTDSMLNGVSNGKVLVLGIVWSGNLKPIIDAHIDAVEELMTPFTAGNVLNAEPAPRTLNLARVYVGNMERSVSDARHAVGDTDVTEMMSALAQLRGQMNVAAPSGSAIADSLRRLKRARDAIKAPRGLQRDGLAVLHEKERTQIRATQTAADQHWDPSLAAATGKVRDALHAATTATTERARITAVSDAHKAFWAGRS